MGNHIFANGYLSAQRFCYSISQAGRIFYSATSRNKGSIEYNFQVSSHSRRRDVSSALDDRTDCSEYVCLRVTAESGDVVTDKLVVRVPLCHSKERNGCRENG